MATLNGIPTNGKPKGPPLTLEQLQERRRLLAERVEIKRLTRLREMWDRYYNFTTDDYWTRIRPVTGDGKASPFPTQPGDRRHGRNWPYCDNETDLERFRSQSRNTATVNSFAQGLLRNRRNYTIGKGFAYNVVSKELIDADKSRPGVQDPDWIKRLVQQTQDIVDDFLRRNRWNGMPDPRGPLIATSTKEQEAYWRLPRDGEAFLRLYFDAHTGKTVVRFIDPERIKNPPGATPADGWTFGIRHQMTPFEDVETILEYHVMWQDPATIVNGKAADYIGEVVPANQMFHFKNPGTDSTIKRSLPDFIFDTGAALERAAKLEQCISLGAAIRAATAETWQYAGATEEQITSLASSLAETTIDNPITGRTENIERFYPGMTRRIPEGQEMVTPPPDQSASFVAALQADLRMASASFAAPEYWSGMTDNGNFSNLETASAPTVKNGETEQEYYKPAFGRVVWAAVSWAVECNVLPSDIYQYIDIQVEAPAVLHQNKMETAQADQIYTAMGAKSPQTVMMELGLDPDIEQANIQEYREVMGGAGAQLGDDPAGGGDGSDGGFPSAGDEGGRQLPDELPGEEETPEARQWPTPECGGEGGEPGPCPKGGGAKPSASRNYKARISGSGKTAAVEVLGKDVTPEDMGAMIGAPAGSPVSINSREAGKLSVEVNTDDVTISRTFSKDAAGKVVCENTDFQLSKSEQGKGLGSKVFSDQVAACKAAGVDRIITKAAGKPGGNQNGYYTWARQGYDGPLPESVAAKAQAAFPGAKNVSDVMAAPGGAEWWKANGASFQGTFDLNDGSTSMKVHAAYQAERAKRAGGGAKESNQEAVADDGKVEYTLTPEEEKDLAKAWAAVLKQKA